MRQYEYVVQVEESPIGKIKGSISFDLKEDNVLGEFEILGNKLSLDEKLNGSNSFSFKGSIPVMFSSMSFSADCEFDDEEIKVTVNLGVSKMQAVGQRVK